MLQELRVQNLAVVEATTVLFGPALNVITGETGAGKSVLMGALHLLLGERAAKTLIRTGQEEASVAATFLLGAQSPIPEVLAESGVPECEDGVLVIRRTLSLSGNGKILVNDTPATSQLLKRLAPALMDIHGPNDQQALLDPSFQRDLLTAYAKAEAPLRAYQEIWASLQKLKAERESCVSDPVARAVELEKQQFIIAEIREVNPTDEDGETLVQQHTEAANAETILSTASGVTQQLTEGENTTFDQLAQVNQALLSLCSILPKANDWSDELNSIQIQLQDLSQSIAQYLQDTEVSQARFEQLEQRMAQIQKLKHRYGRTIPDILETLARAEERLNELNEYEVRVQKLDREIQKAERELHAAGASLSEARKSAIPSLSKAITAELRDLGFLQSSFPIRCEACEPTPFGMDAVTYCFEPNPGEAARSLSDIASSGEIARVMLAVKAILARHDQTPTLIFDEIDANIGGETGRSVGEKLHGLAKHCQIICITHQPQAAIYGDNHYAVSKRVVKDRTLTTIQQLSPEARIEEIARMLGGRDLTSVTLEHAREMLVHAQGASHD